MRLLPPISIILCLALASSCQVSVDGWSWGSGDRVEGSGLRASDPRPVENFEAIAVSGSFRLKLRIGPPTSVEIEADDNLLELVETRVEQGKLHVRTTGSYSTDLGIVVHISTPHLVALSASGAHDVEIVGVEGTRFSIDASGANEIRATGTVEELIVSLSGSCKVDLVGLRSQRAELSASGNVDGALHASESLKLDLSGSSSITYEGSPRIEVDQSGASSVRAR